MLLLGEKKKERVWERKGLRVGPDRRVADFSLPFWIVLFTAWELDFQEKSPK